MDPALDTLETPPLTSAFLDPLESPPTAPGPPVEAYTDELSPTLAWNAEHNGWRERRQRVWHALLTAGASDARRRRFALCGQHYWILAHRHEHGHYRLVPDHCHDRFCSPCAQRRASIVRSRLEQLLPKHPLRMLTLTIRSRAQGLPRQIDRIYEAFAVLRQHPYWHARVRGWLAVLEVTINAETALWHPHLHVLCDADWLHVDRLRKLWLLATGDSFVVNVRLAGDNRDAVRYVTKYLQKAASGFIYDHPEVLADYLAAVHHRRLLLTGGDWSRWNLTRPLSQDDWQLIGHECRLRSWSDQNIIYLAWCTLAHDQARTMTPILDFYLADDEPRPPPRVRTPDHQLHLAYA